VGASGAVFGVAGAFFAFLLRNRTRIEPQLGGQLRRSIITFLLLNLAIGFTVPGIDQAAHLGGLVTGFASGLVAGPSVGPQGLVRPHARYGLVAIVGVGLCAAAWAGVNPLK
jgi:rhomboid protease GluP